VVVVIVVVAFAAAVLFKPGAAAVVVAFVPAADDGSICPRISPCWCCVVRTVTYADPFFIKLIRSVTFFPKSGPSSLAAVITSLTNFPPQDPQNFTSCHGVKSKL
jgi:hypothetical protein